VIYVIYGKGNASKKAAERINARQARRKGGTGGEAEED
jgi:hypothetical protein